MEAFTQSGAWRRSSERAERDMLGHVRTAAVLRQVMPNATEQAVRQFAAPLYGAMRDYGIETPEQQAAFLANVAVESGQLGAATGSIVEGGNYTDVRRLMQIYPSRFKTPEAAQPFLRNPRGLFNYVYADRIGNGGVASGDGYRFRGRGLLQITGRNNYRDAERSMNNRYANNFIDGRIGPEVRLVDDPDRVAEDAVVAARTAADYWTRHGATANTLFSDKDTFDNVTKRLNRRPPDMAARRAAYDRARQALGIDPPAWRR